MIETEYRYVAVTRDGQELDEFVNATNRKFAIYLNKPGRYSFTLSVMDEKATQQNLAPIIRGVRVYRNDKVMIAGDNYTLSISGSNNENVINVAGNSYLQRLAARTVSGVATNRWTEAIINGQLNQCNYWNHTGVTMGTHERLYQRSFTFEDKKLLDLIDSIAKGDGADYMVDNNRKLHYWGHRGITRDDFIFQHGMNIVNPQWDIDASKLINLVNVYGKKPSEEAPPPMYQRVNSASKGYYGQWDEHKRMLDDTDANYLRAIGDDILDESAYPKDIFKFTLIPGLVPEFGEFGLGDTVWLKIDWGKYFSVNQRVRIKGFEVDIADDGKEVATVVTEIPDSLAKNERDLIQRMTQVEQKINIETV
jgi:hypothetical protein